MQIRSGRRSANYQAVSNISSTNEKRGFAMSDMMTVSSLESLQEVEARSGSVMTMISLGLGKLAPSLMLGMNKSYV